MKKKRKALKKPGKIKRTQASIEEPDLPPHLEKYYKVLKHPITLRLDADILAWFQKGGRGYQTRINSALRKVMLAVKKR